MFSHIRRLSRPFSFVHTSESARSSSNADVLAVEAILAVKTNRNPCLSRGFVYDPHAGFDHCASDGSAVGADIICYEDVAHGAAVRFRPGHRPGRPHCADAAVASYGTHAPDFCNSPRGCRCNRGDLVVDLCDVGSGLRVATRKAAYGPP